MKLIPTLILATLMAGTQAKEPNSAYLLTPQDSSLAFYASRIARQDGLQLMWDSSRDYSIDNANAVNRMARPDLADNTDKALASVFSFFEKTQPNQAPLFICKSKQTIIVREFGMSPCKEPLVVVYE